jgi:uncharacterized membrane protein YvbJ
MQNSLKLFDDNVGCSIKYLSGEAVLIDQLFKELKKLPSSNYKKVSPLETRIKKFLYSTEISKNNHSFENYSIFFIIYFKNDLSFV